MKIWVHRISMLSVLVASTAWSGCTVQRVDFSTIRQPDVSKEMNAFGVFVGSWTWEAEMKNASEADRHWKGTAEWAWDLDGRALRGSIESKSASAEFKSEGIWSWHPTRQRYVWWMFNNWGYPQSGTARLSPCGTEWTMNYRSVGLDGTPSHGRYHLTVVNRDTLSWSVVEWADALHLVKKMEMCGTYNRVR